MLGGVQIGGAVHPAYPGDLFSPDALRHPFEHYRSIRDLGAAVWLPATRVYAIGRFTDLRAALRAADVLVSGQAFVSSFNN